MKAKVEITFDSPTENYSAFRACVDEFLKSLEVKKLSDGENLEIKIHPSEEKILLMEERD
jgi:hypothetical protein